MTVFRTKWFETAFRNQLLSDNRKDDKADKAFKMRQVTGHLNSEFSEMLLNDSE